MDIFQEYADEAVRKVAPGLRAEGRAISIVRVLESRRIPVSAAARRRIKACKDLERLDVWLSRAVTAASVHEVFGSGRRRSGARTRSPVGAAS
jgi:hypothetical protein